MVEGLTGLMEKVIIAVRSEAGDLSPQLLGPVAEALLDLDLPGVTVNVRDAAVRDSLMTLTTLAPPVQAFVSLWVEQHYAPQVSAAIQALRPVAESVAAYLVTESAPMPPPPSPPGQRAAGLVNVALLRRPAELDEATWLTRWQRDHTPVAIETQSTFGYVRNEIFRPITEGAPMQWTAIVEESFPIEALTDPHAFYDAKNEAEYQVNFKRMMDSCGRFLDHGPIEVTFVSEYYLG